MNQYLSGGTYEHYEPRRKYFEAIKKYRRVYAGQRTQALADLFDVGSITGVEFGTPVSLSSRSHHGGPDGTVWYSAGVDAAWFWALGVVRIGEPLGGLAGLLGLEPIHDGGPEEKPMTHRDSNGRDFALDGEPVDGNRGVLQKLADTDNTDCFGKFGGAFTGPDFHDRGLIRAQQLVKGIQKRYTL